MYYPGGYEDELDTSDEDDLGFFSCGPKYKPPPPVKTPVELLRQAVMNGELDKVNDILKTDTKLASACEPTGSKWSILMYACSARNPALIRILLDNGANPNHLTTDGFTPILALVTSNDNGYSFDHGEDTILQGIQLLIERGANVNRCGNNPIAYAAKENRHKVVKFFIDKGVSVNGSDKAGYTALHYAAEQGHGRMVRYLLENGADANIRTRDDSKPGDLAAENEFDEISAMLELAATTRWRPGLDPKLADVERDTNGERKISLEVKSHIAGLLELYKLEHLIPLFIEQDISYVTFLRLTDQDLIDMGVDDPNDRKNILDHTTALKNSAKTGGARHNSIFLEGNITYSEMFLMLTDIERFVEGIKDTFKKCAEEVKSNEEILVIDHEILAPGEIAEVVQENVELVESIKNKAIQLQSVIAKAAEIPGYK